MSANHMNVEFPWGKNSERHCSKPRMVGGQGAERHGGLLPADRDTRCDLIV